MNFYPHILSLALMSAVLPSNAETTHRSIPLDCGGWLSGFAIHSTGRLYGFGDVFGMWRSDDAGSSWKYLQSDFTTFDHFIYGCAVASGDVDQVAFLSSNKLFKSTNGGATWTNLLSNLSPRRDRGASPVFFHPGDDQDIWLASARSGLTGTLWRSLDGGSNWSKVGGTTFDSVKACGIHVRPEFPDQVWVGAEGGLYVSADRGATWTRVWNNGGINNSLFNTPPTAVAIARRADGVGYVATNVGGYRVTASNFNNPATYLMTKTVSWWDGWGPDGAAVLADGSFITETANNNTSRSGDGGLTWNVLPMRLVTPPTPPWTTPAISSSKADGARDMIVQDPTNTSRWFMTGGISPVTTTDSGTTWKYPPTLNGLAGVPTYKVRFARGNPAVALIPGSDQGGFTVTDGGAGGQVANCIRTSINEQQTYHEIMSSTDGLTLVAAGTDQGNNANIITRSTNGGVSWAKLNLASTGLPLSYHGITRSVMAPGNPLDFLVLLGSESSKPNNNPGLYRTLDGGISFTKATGIPDGVGTGQRYHPANSWLETDGITAGTRYLSLRSSDNATARGFYRSTDGGSNWAKTSLPFEADWIHSMVVDRSSAGRIWVAGGYRGIKTSSNGGDSWTSVSGFNDATRIDAVNGQVAVWGRRSGDTWNKIYFSPNNGVTWSEKTGVNHRYANLSDLAVDPNQAGKIWVSGMSVNVISFFPRITANQTAIASRNEPFAYNILSSAGTTTWNLVNGALPNGITLNRSTGVLSGTATESGTFPLTMSATEASITGPTEMVSLTVSAVPFTGAHESFTYEGGSLAIQNGGSGWSGAWDSAANGISAASSTYISGSAALQSSGGQAHINHDSATFRPIANTSADGTYWLGFIAHSSNPGSAYAGLSLHDGNDERLFIGQRYNSSTWGIERSGVGADSTSNTGSRSFLVVKVVLKPGNDDVYFWVNPALEVPPAETTATKLLDVADFSFNRIRLAHGLGSGQIFSVDEIRIGQSFTEIAPYTLAPSGIQIFRAANGLPADGSQDTTKPAGDEVANLLKFAFNMIGTGTGQAPAVSVPNSQTLSLPGNAGLPLARLDAVTDKLQLSYIRRRQSSAPGILYEVQFCNDLKTAETWDVNPSATETTTIVDSIFEIVTVTDSPQSVRGRFARIKVTAP